MSLQLILGGSGSGKSYNLYSRMIQDSIENPKDNFLVIVPEQYTMETQKKLVSMHPRRGIMNIDIVSFQRLAFRVFSEIGGGDTKVLDDTGKNLIVRKVLESNKKQLKIFGNNINKIGFVSEMKSIISELLQYAITPQQVTELGEKISDNPLLNGKLSDVQTIYSAFKKYIDEKYITAEEILDVLCGVIEDSQMIKNSVIAIDGFTGFTPIQYKLLGILLKNAKKVVVTVTIDGNEKINVHQGMQNIFFLSKETISTLIEIAEKQQVNVENHILLNDDDCYRLKNSPDLSFLEKNLFRFNGKRYEKVPESLLIFEGTNPKEEISFIAGEIMRITAENGYRFRDIAVVTGDIETYGDIAANIFNQNNISSFIDNKRSIMGNPFVDFLRSALETIEKGYSYDSVFRYLKTGFTDISIEDIDELENYCLAMGIRGAKKWREKWVRNFRNSRGEKADLDKINLIRKQVVASLETLNEKLKDKDANVNAYILAVYEFVVSMNIQHKLDVYADMFEKAGDKSRSGEFKQIYKKVMDLLDKMVELLGEENMHIKEFAQILDAGFEDIKIGLIPPSADSVVVGDIERTRLENIKVLFFVGVNDGIVPKKSENHGILSEFDRESIEELKVKLAPSAREKAFIQKFYLYLNMTKPSQKLYVSYAKNDMNGKSIRPSFLVHTLKKMFPLVKMVDSKGAKTAFKYVRIPKSELVWSQENCIQSLSEATALALYGKDIYGSVTRIENFAACEYAHFLNYGLSLVEREEYQLAVRDVGTILHSVLEKISTTLKFNDSNFAKLNENDRKKLVTECVVKVTNDYGNTIMQDSKRNEYIVNRLTDIADRTVWALGKQLEHGEFEPDAFEVPFQLEAEDLPNNARMILHGKIDRIDICEDEKNVYVKVIDYKSGHSDFDLLNTYYGLRLQLMAYMKAAVEIEGKIHVGKNIIPAGVLYYNIDDPIVEKEDEDQESTEARILEQLCTKGLVNSDKNVVKKFDNIVETGKSKVIPVKYSKDGEVASTRNTISSQQFKALDSFVYDKMKDMSSDIVNGGISINPYKDKKSCSCTYCQYNAVCGFYEDLPGMEYRKLKQFDDETLWTKIYAKENLVDISGQSITDYKIIDKNDIDTNIIGENGVNPNSAERGVD